MWRGNETMCPRWEWKEKLKISALVKCAQEPRRVILALEWAALPSSRGPGCVYTIVRTLACMYQVCIMYRGPGCVYTIARLLLPAYLATHDTWRHSSNFKDLENRHWFDFCSKWLQCERRLSFWYSDFNALWVELKYYVFSIRIHCSVLAVRSRIPEVWIRIGTEWGRSSQSSLAMRIILRYKSNWDWVRAVY